VLFIAVCVKSVNSMEDRYSWLPSACKVQAFDIFPYSASDVANEVTVIANKLRRRISL